MKTLTAIAILIILSVGTSTVCSQEAQTGHSVEQVKKVTSKFKNGKRYKVEYDKFDDVTNVTFDSFMVSKSMEYTFGGFMLFMGARIQFAGNGIHNAPTGAALFFYAKGKNWSFLKNHDFKVLVDGERKTFDATAIESSIGRDIIGVEYQTNESMVFSVTIDDLKLLADGKKVEMRLGQYEISVKSEHQQMFRDLLSLAPSPSK